MAFFIRFNLTCLQQYFCILAPIMGYPAHEYNSKIYSPANNGWQTWLQAMINHQQMHLQPFIIGSTILAGRLSLVVLAWTGVLVNTLISNCGLSSLERSDTTIFAWRFVRITNVFMQLQFTRSTFWMRKRSALWRNKHMEYIVFIGYILILHRFCCIC